MPRFPIAFRRRSTTTEEAIEPPAESSFRVIDRESIASTKSFDGGAKFSKSAAKISSSTVDENLLVEIKTDRSSNISKASDNSSHHSTTSTAPSSTDRTTQDAGDWRSASKKTPDTATPPPHSSAGGFFKQAGKNFSFGGKKHNLSISKVQDIVPESRGQDADQKTTTVKPRAPAVSSVDTVATPKVEARDVAEDSDGDQGNMFSILPQNDMVASPKDKGGRQPLGSRDLTGNRIKAPPPLKLDDPSRMSWQSNHSQQSNEALLTSGSRFASPTNENTPPPSSIHIMSPLSRRSHDGDDGDYSLLRDTMAANRYLACAGEDSPPPVPVIQAGRRYDDGIPSLQGRGHEDTIPGVPGLTTRQSGHGTKPAPRSVPSKPLAQPLTKIMTPAQFEKYRSDKVRESRSGDTHDSDDEEDINYDDDEDDREKSKEMAKQRQKQEAHMILYRQQMMKVTGERDSTVPRSDFSTSLTTPNPTPRESRESSGPPSDASEEDEEVPLAILAAHGFPSKNRPPARPSTSAANANLRPSTPGPSSSGINQPSGGGPLPAFARRLPHDPFLGAGLMHQTPRESFALGGGAPAAQTRATPVGGLVGVIASEERKKALRRGSPSPNFDALRNSMVMQVDPMAGIPPQMMYPTVAPPMSMMMPGDQVQIQMNQQMQQFMQMQMQFMQMMAGPSPASVQGLPRPPSYMPSQAMGSVVDLPRHSFMDVSGQDPQSRTMSLVRPGSSHWMHPPSTPGYTTSGHAQGTGYAPSIAPSERSNVGLPGRYRPVTSANLDAGPRSATMSGSVPSLSKLQTGSKMALVSSRKDPDEEDDDDEEKAWEAMKATRDRKKNVWRSKKSFGSDIGALIG